MLDFIKGFKRDKEDKVTGNNSLVHMGKKLLKDRIKDFIKMKIGMILLTSLPIILIVIFVLSSLSFFAFSMIVVYAQNKAEQVAENTSKMLEIYSEELSDIFKDSDVGDYYTGEEPVGTPVNPDNSYDDTLTEADKISGSSLLHQVYNAIVENVNKTGMTGYSVEYVLGANYTEMCCGHIKWLPYFALAKEAASKPDFNLNKWGVDDVLQYKAQGALNIRGYGQRYMGPFQTDYTSWNSSLGMPSTSWSDAQWKQFVSGSSKSNDGNGDGVGDIFNFHDALQSMSNYATGKMNFINGYKLKSTQNESDMLTMFLATRHVGTQGRKSSATGSWAKPDWNTWKYPYEEGLNPHVDLMRQAINEYKTGGPHYIKYKNFLEGQSQTSSNGPESAQIIREFYLANGWKYEDGYMVKAYPNGQGNIYIKGNADQDIYYAFRVYWGGKIGAESIKKVLTNSNN